MPHASWLEVVYTIIAACALTSSALGLWIARSNYRHKAQKAGVRPLRVFMLKSVYDFAKAPLFIHVWIMANAIWAITHAPPPPAPSQQSIGNVVSWIVVTTAMMYHQMRGFIWRRQLDSGEFDPTGTTIMPEESDDAA